MIDAVTAPQLYDLELDWGESRNVAAQNDDVVARLMRLAESVRAEIGDFDRIGSDARFFDTGAVRPRMGAWRK